jgi:chemotaxis protein MotA
MLFLIGCVVVMASVAGGYLMHGGELSLLWQPSEYIIIIGSAIGAFIISNPLSRTIDSLKSFKYLFSSKPYSKKEYLELLSLKFNIFRLMKIKGMLVIESHIEKPEESEIFNTAPTILKNKRVLDMIRDYLRVMTMGVDNPYQFEEMIEKEIDIFEHEELAPGKALTTLGDSMPALGIVAAVLGVIITMRSITEPPEVLGGLIGAALVGTFTGVLAAYGFVLPLATYIKCYSEDKVAFLKCIKSGFLSHMNGNAPVITVEFMRKNIPEHYRPDFYETDEFINNNSKNFS